MLQTVPTRLVTGIFNLPVSHQQDQAVDAASEHDRIFIDTIFGQLDERWKGNRPDKKQDVGDLINPRYGSRQQDQAKGCGWARKGAGHDEPRRRVPQSDTD